MKRPLLPSLGAALVALVAAVGCRPESHAALTSLLRTITTKPQ